MIIFEKLRWKNFLSTGNQFIEMDLTKSPSTLIIGSNGAGKSTMLDALCFGLFNKPFRKINKPQLANTINEKECCVEVEFKIGSVEYKVIRGLKPAIFEIYRNGALLDQDAANRDYQKYLEQNVLKLNFKSFTQVVILGSSTFVPFMQLPAAHRREVIEDLLDIQVFSQMNAILKDRIKDTKDEIGNCQHELALAQQAVDLKSENIKNLELQSTAYLDEKKLKLQSNIARISEIDNECCYLQLQVTESEPKVVNLSTLKEQYDKLKEFRTKIKQNLDQTKKNKTFYESNDECPTCTQTIDEAWKAEQCESLSERIEKYDAGVADLTDKIKKVLAEIDEVETVNSDLVEKRYTINSLLKEQTRLQKDNIKLEQEINAGSPNIDKEREVLDVLLAASDEKQFACSQINKRFGDLKVVGNLLKDGGIKTKIIKKFVPTINRHINKYLQEMDFFVNFTLDDEFNEVIKSRFRDVFTYASFSEGEKQKIDLALLFTWRSIAKLKNSVATNLLILDEVFDSSLDSAATVDLLKILKGLPQSTNLFVISHKGEILLDKFHRTVSFDKPNDFSRMTEIE